MKVEEGSEEEAGGIRGESEYLVIDMGHCYD